MANSTPRESSTGFVHRAGGVVFAATALIGLGVGLLLLGRIDAYLNDPANRDSLDATAFPDVIMLLIEHRALFMALCAPALVGGVLLAAGARPRRLWYAVGALGILVMIGALIVCLLALLVPLYTYREL